jgi:hypothetical protein
MVSTEPIGKARLQRGQRAEMGNSAPEFGKSAFGSLMPTLDQTAGEHGSVDRPGARRADAVERDALFLEQAIENAPGEGAMRASALERKVDQLEVGRAARPDDPGRLAFALWQPFSPTAAKLSRQEDSPTEEDGFEPSAPPDGQHFSRLRAFDHSGNSPSAPETGYFAPRTEGSKASTARRRSGGRARAVPLSSICARREAS